MKPVMESCCPSQRAALEELDRVAPNAPFLALGQTVFWDEPLKIGVPMLASRLGMPRKFVAGIHDTDYFAKLPSQKEESGYVAVPHNDTTTKGLWSAAGEFSTLFGSETVVTKEAFLKAGLRLQKVQQRCEGALDCASEAWGWRGLVSLSHENRVSAETALGPLFDALNATFNWAVDTSLEHIGEDTREEANRFADQMRTVVCDLSEPRESQTLSSYYKRLLPAFHQMTAGETLDTEITTTTDLLRFNSDTWHLPRFEIVSLFADPATRARACQAYNETVSGKEMYTLDRFGSGAIPFDLVIPGRGRGTIRLAKRALVIMTPTPSFITLKRPLANLADLAEAIEAKFGPNCTLVGKAITLIGMMAREFVFVFHEGGSGYVTRSREFHGRLAQTVRKLEMNPILRVKYKTWQVLDATSATIKLPEPMRRPFGKSEISAEEFSLRWKEVAASQVELLEELGRTRRPLDLIQVLVRTVGDPWESKEGEFVELLHSLDRLQIQIDEIKSKKREIAKRIKQAKIQRVEAEHAKGRHWRERFFEKTPTEADQKERARLESVIQLSIREIDHAKHEWRQMQAEQDAAVKDAAVIAAHEGRREIETEAEMTRMRLIREAILCSKGLENAGKRPSAWWFPLVCTEGKWFKKTLEKAQWYLEPLN